MAEARDKLPFEIIFVSVALAKEISFDAAVTAVLCYYGNFTLKEEQRAALKSFPGGKDVYVLPSTGFGKSLDKHYVLHFECNRQKVCPVTLKVF